LQKAGFSTKLIGEAMDNYAETLTDADIDAINAGTPTSGLGPFSTDVRRQIRAMTLIERAKTLVTEVKKEGGSVNYKSSKAKQIKAINP
jgi:hypothetical protein